MPTLSILDVGHGNCAVIEEDEQTVVVDAPLGHQLIKFLNGKGISEVLMVFISHSDADHVNGIIQLLLNVPVKRVYLNPEQTRSTRVWKSLHFALQFAINNWGTEVITALTSHSPGHVDLGDLRFHILSPQPVQVLKGSGGTDSGRTLTNNSLSAAILVKLQDCGQILLAADMDRVAFDALAALDVPLDARILVFPHHGGKPGSSNAQKFARDLSSMVQPELVVFSISRSRKAFPNSDVVSGVRQGAPAAHIACTQLSVQCSTVIPRVPQGHLSTMFAHGFLENSCCAGTLEIDLASETFYSNRSNHASFVNLYIPSALCR